jgi:hypothetical protein
MIKNLISLALELLLTSEARINTSSLKLEINVVDRHRDHKNARCELRFGKGAPPA